MRRRTFLKFLGLAPAVPVVGLPAEPFPEYFEGVPAPEPSWIYMGGEYYPRRVGDSERLFSTQFDQTYMPFYPGEVGYEDDDWKDPA